MFREKYLTFQRGLPSGWFQGSAKPTSSQPESQKPPEITGKATEVQRRAAAEKFAVSRREVMETSPEVADRILEDIFGHNADLVKQELGPKYELIIKNIGESLKPGDKYLRSVLIADRLHIIFQLEGHPVDMDLATVLLLSDEEVRSLEPLITLKRKAVLAKPETVWNKAEKVIQGEIMDVIFAFKPDDVPDTLEVEEILATPMIKEIRAKLVKSYKAGKPYEVTTTDQGFKLESQDLPDQEFDIEEFWDKFAATARLDAQLNGRLAEEMSLEEIKLLLLGDEKRGIQGRSIGEIAMIYGQIPWGHIYDLTELETKEHFSDISTGRNEIWDFENLSSNSMPEEDRSYIIDLTQKYLAILSQRCPELKNVDKLVIQFKNANNPNDREYLYERVKDKLFGYINGGTVNQVVAAGFYNNYFNSMKRAYTPSF